MNQSLGDTRESGNGCCPLHAISNKVASYAKKKKCKIQKKLENLNKKTCVKNNVSFRIATGKVESYKNTCQTRVKKVWSKFIKHTEKPKNYSSWFADSNAAMTTTQDETPKRSHNFYASAASLPSVYFTPEYKTSLDETSWNFIKNDFGKKSMYAKDDRKTWDSRTDCSIVCGHIDKTRMMMTNPVMSHSSPQGGSDGRLQDTSPSARWQSHTLDSLTFVSPIPDDTTLNVSSFPASFLTCSGGDVSSVPVMSTDEQGMTTFTVMVDNNGVRLPCLLEETSHTGQCLHEVYHRAGADLKLSGTIPVSPGWVSATSVEYVLTHWGTYVCLGEGQYGRVYLGRIKLTGKLVAIKMFKKTTTAIADVITEASVLQELNGSEVTPTFHGLLPLHRHPTYKQVAIVMDFVGDSQTFKTLDFRRLVNSSLRSRGANRIRMLDSEWLLVLTSIMEKISTAHSHNIILNDIKSDNILMENINGTWHPYIIDVGLSIFQKNSTRNLAPPKDIEGYLETYRQVAPEVAYKGTCSAKSDVFSFGRLLEGIHSYVGVPIKEMAIKCLRINQDERLGDEQVLSELYVHFNKFKKEEDHRKRIIKLLKESFKSCN